MSQGFDRHRVEFVPVSMPAGLAGSALVVTTGAGVVYVFHAAGCPPPLIEGAAAVPALPLHDQSVVRWLCPDLPRELLADLLGRARRSRPAPGGPGLR